MKYLYILALAFTLSACAQQNSVNYDNHDQDTGNQTSGPKAWRLSDLPLTVYVPVEMNAYKVSIQNSAATWGTALGRPVFNFVFDDTTKPNTQYSGDPYASLYDSYFGLFKELTWNFPGKVDNNVLAFTGTLTLNGRITHSDVLFNFATFRFGDVDLDDGPANDATRDNQLMDFESVLTHELGHFLGLGHVTTEPASVMGVSITPQTKKRVLSPEDTARIRALYGL